jgi:peptide/nickel transport system substrate-binding protein
LERGFVLAGRLNRRDMLKRTLAFGLGVPAVAGLLAACGDDDDDREATSPAATATSGAGASPTSGASPTAAASPTSAEASPTTAGASPTAAASPTSAEASPTAAASPTGGTGVVEGGDRLMGKQIEEAQSEGGTFIEGSTLDLRSLLPMLWNDQPSFAFGATIFEAMIDVHPETLDPVGNLAEGWEVSEDGMTWTMYLRDGVSWHDGEPFTADDVKFSFDYYLNGDVPQRRCRRQPDFQLSAEN